MCTLCIIFTCSIQLVSFVGLFAFINEASLEANQMQELSYFSKKNLVTYTEQELLIKGRAFNIAVVEINQLFHVSLKWGLNFIKIVLSQLIHLWQRAMLYL